MKNFKISGVFRWWFSVAALVLVSIILALISYFKSVFIHKEITDDILQNIGSATMILQFVLYTVLILTLFKILSKNKMTASDFGFTFNNFKTTILTVILGSIFLIGSVKIWEYFYPKTAESAQQIIKTLEIGKNFNQNILTLLSITILAPVGEEILFRGAYFSSIYKGLPESWGKLFPMIIAIIFSSFMFADSHGGEGQGQQFYILFFFGLVMVLSFIITKSLYAPILIHSINNSHTVFEATNVVDNSSYPMIYLQIFILISPIISFLFAYLVQFILRSKTYFA